MAWVLIVSVPRLSQEDLEDEVFTTLPAVAADYHSLIPSGWVTNLGAAQSCPMLGSRVLIYCWDNWSCGVVSKVFDRHHRRPQCQITGMRATVCVHWPSEKNEDGEVMHTYMHLSKNNNYGGGARRTQHAVRTGCCALQSFVHAPSRPGLPLLLVRRTRGSGGGEAKTAPSSSFPAASGDAQRPLSAPCRAQRAVRSGRCEEKSSVCSLV